jgi:hypothetical protein
MEPDLPPGTVCGGLPSVYVPDLSVAELLEALTLDGLSDETKRAIRAEIDRRALKRKPDYLCSVWMRNRMDEDTQRETDQLIERLRVTKPTRD